jgi:cobyrinic acid a,c-diamide synthase
VAGGVHASYLHTHPAGDPEAVARFVRACHPFVAGAADGTVFA